MKSEGGIDFTVWDDELEHLPLGPRKKMLVGDKGGLSVISHCDAGELVHLPLAQEAQQIPLNGSSANSIESLVGSRISEPASVKPMTCSTKNSADHTTMPGFPGIKYEYNNEVADDFDSGLDHIVLKKRQQMLQLREVSELSKESSVGNGGEGLIQCYEGAENEYISGVNNGEQLAAESLERSAFSLGTSAIHCSSPKEIPQRCSISSSNVSVNCRSYDQGDFSDLDSKAKDDKFSQNLMTVKDEVDIPGQNFENDIESVPLTDRSKELCSGKHANGISWDNVFLKKLPSPSNSNLFYSESFGQPKTSRRPWKRKKTATDSVKIALEEDAPGLLQVLMDKGVLVDEIKLYDEMEGDDALDDSLCEESFSELEAVISKVFFQRHSILKFAPHRAAKASRASYCLACLLALVEQSRYLQFREWPVEWGWCRDLQSFIFVFERHNRIVLERPEYGYATYFFELVNSLPLNWQIKRLVIAMKLTSCSRISVLENKPLVVGEDLSDGEAKVLEEYGWVPNSGLGTMLNYRDRVIHDRKEDTSDWSSKIGKCLVDGYKNGHLIPSDIPKKAEDYIGDQITQVKVETD